MEHFNRHLRRIQEEVHVETEFQGVYRPLQLHPWALVKMLLWSPELLPAASRSASAVGVCDLSPPSDMSRLTWPTQSSGSPHHSPPWRANLPAPQISPSQYQPRPPHALDSRLYTTPTPTDQWVQSPPTWLPLQSWGLHSEPCPLPSEGLPLMMSPPASSPVALGPVCSSTWKLPPLSIRGFQFNSLLLKGLSSSIVFLTSPFMGKLTC